MKYHKSRSRGTEHIFISYIRVFFFEQCSGGNRGGRRDKNSGRRGKNKYLYC